MPSSSRRKTSRVKLLGERIQNRPSVYLEMRSYALHTHPEGPQGACRAALAWVREKLYADQPSKLVNDAISFEAAKLSRADVHIDYQGGYAPSLSNVSDELRCFIRPGKTKGALYFQGSRPTGLCLWQRPCPGAALQQDTGDQGEEPTTVYAALLLAKNGEDYDQDQDVWRLEFQLRREGAKGFKLYAPPEEDDDEAEIEAELAAEELQHIGTLPRFFARMNELVLFLTQHWLRLVEDTVPPIAPGGRPIPPGWRYASSSLPSPRHSHSTMTNDDSCADLATVGRIASCGDWRLGW